MEEKVIATQKILKTGEINRNNRSYHLSKACIICNEPVALSSEEEIAVRHNHSIDSKVCDKCRQAILLMRSQL